MKNATVTVGAEEAAKCFKPGESHERPSKPLLSSKYDQNDQLSKQCSNIIMRAICVRFMQHCLSALSCAMSQKNGLDR